METLSFRQDIQKSLIIMVGLLSGLYVISRHNFLLFHSLSEMFSIVIAGSIFIIAWNTWKEIGNNYLLVLGIAFLFVGILDMIHTLAYKGMGVFPDYGGNLATQLWIATRYLQSLSLVIAPLFIHRQVKRGYFLCGYSLATVLLLSGIFYWNIFPVCYVDGVGLTPFKKISEYVISLVLIGSIRFLFHLKSHFDKAVFNCLVAAIIVSILSELTFTFYISLYGLFNTLGHFFKIISFYLVYKAIVETGLKRPYALLMTDLKNSELALQKRQVRYQTLFEQSHDAILIFDANGQILETNDQATRILGYSREELQEKTISNLLGTNIPTPADSVEASRLELVFSKLDNARMDIAFDFRPIDTEAGIFLGMIRDITEQKQAADVERKSKQKYVDLFDDAPIMYVITENRNSMPLVRNANKLFLSTLGYAGEEVIGQPLETFYTPESRHQLNFGGYHRALTGQFTTEERNLVSRSGQIVFTKLQALPETDDAGRVIGTRAAFIDITESKRLEKQLFQAQKMEAIGSLAGGIAHDFNNILSAVMGYTELSLQMTDSGTRLADNLREVMTAANRAKDLVRQILTFARKTNEEQTPVQVGIIAKEALKLLRSSIPATIDIRQHIGSNSLVMGNATQIHQIFMNLCTNAAQAMEENGGILDVQVRDVADGACNGSYPIDLDQKDLLLITVSDTGTGIPEENLDKIFDPYFTTKDVHKGTGLGLSVVHSIVEHAGGKIFVDCAPEKGTVFSIYLPIIQRSAEPCSPETQNLPTGSERILFVDDELPIANLGSQMLKVLGYDVAIRTSSPDALALFRSQPDHFDLVITDMTMPQMTGDRLARELIDIRPDIPVILCTGYSNRIFENSARQTGIRALIHKPFNLADLAGAIRNVLDE